LRTNKERWIRNRKRERATRKIESMTERGKSKKRER
jgi:hypothetical protein